jgi:hypothetical protein
VLSGGESTSCSLLLVLFVILLRNRRIIFLLHVRWFGRCG